MLPMSAGLRLGRLLHATGFDIRPSRPTLEPSDLVALGINRSPKLGHFPKQLQHQIFQFGVRKAVQVGRQHSQNESDLRPLVNRTIVPPRLLPLLPMLEVRLIRGRHRGLLSMVVTIGVFGTDQFRPLSQGD